MNIPIDQLDPGFEFQSIYRGFKSTAYSVCVRTYAPGPVRVEINGTALAETPADVPSALLAAQADAKERLARYHAQLEQRKNLVQSKAASDAAKAALISKLDLDL